VRDTAPWNCQNRANRPVATPGWKVPPYISAHRLAGPAGGPIRQSGQDVFGGVVPAVQRAAGEATGGADGKSITRKRGGTTGVKSDFEQRKGGEQYARL
jgi:hypothetical protein